MIGKFFYFPVIFNPNLVKYLALAFTTSSLGMDTFEQVLAFEFSNIPTARKRR